MLLNPDSPQPYIVLCGGQRVPVCLYLIFGGEDVVRMYKYHRLFLCLVFILIIVSPIGTYLIWGMRFRPPRIYGVIAATESDFSPFECAGSCPSECT